MRASVFIATSLDGFIARSNGAIDWLPAGGGASATEDYGYKAFLDTVDFIVMGRNTFDRALTFGEWPHAKPVVVLSSRSLAIASDLAASVEVVSGTPAEVVARLSQRGAEHLYVDGGKTIQQFLEARVIQRLVITRIPILIGSGIPLFGPLAHDVRLRHVATRHWPSGLVQSEYASDA